jgi:hypothetical protein
MGPTTGAEARFFAGTLTRPWKGRSSTMVHVPVVRAAGHVHVRSCVGRELSSG